MVGHIHFFEVAPMSFETSFNKDLARKLASAEDDEKLLDQ